MRGASLHAPGDVRVEQRDRPAIVEPTDAVIRLSATCVCGSDLWPYRGIEDVERPRPLGHEYIGIVEEVGDQVTTIEPGQFVVGSSVASDNTCGICRAGYQTSCVNAQFMDAIGTQAELARIPLADGTLVATPGMPSDDLIPSLLAAGQATFSPRRQNDRSALSCPASTLSCVRHLAIGGVIADPRRPHYIRGSPTPLRDAGLSRLP